MVGTLLAIASVCTLLLAGAQIAYENAAHIFNIRLYGTILELYSIEAEEPQWETIFLENFDSKTKGETTFYTHKETGSIVFKTEGPGLWSMIEIVIAVDAKKEKLLGMRVISQAETPGLGARIEEIPFQERFRGVEIRPSLKIVKFAMMSNQVDAISGATKTSDYLEIIINKAVAVLDSSY